jgi:MinD superfamily P-loop ATPase
LLQNGCLESLVADVGRKTFYELGSKKPVIKAAQDAAQDATAELSEVHFGINDRFYLVHRACTSCLICTCLQTAKSIPQGTSGTGFLYLCSGDLTPHMCAGRIHSGDR